MLLNESTAAPAKKGIEVGPRDGRDAAGRDPPPSRGFRGTDVQTADHDDAGLRVEPAGDLYVLGDNRDISCDSRYWGPIKGSSIVGRVVLVWWHDGHPTCTGSDPGR